MDLVSNPDATKVSCLLIRSPNFLADPSGADQVIVATDHLDKNGRSKIKQLCTLPLTGSKCVSRIITNLCVFDCDRANGVLTLVELAEGVTVEEVRKCTDATFLVADVVRNMEDED